MQTFQNNTNLKKIKELKEKHKLLNNPATTMFSECTAAHGYGLTPLKLCVSPVNTPFFTLFLWHFYQSNKRSNWQTNLERQKVVD